METLEEFLQKRFYSLEKLESGMVQLSRATREAYQKRDTTKLTAADLALMKNKDLKYKRIVYDCKFGKQRASKSKGLRQSSTIKHNCPVKIVFVMYRDENGMEYFQISTADSILKHENHSFSQALYEHIPNKERLQPEAKADILTNLKNKGNVKNIQCYAKEKYGYDGSLKDLRNMKSKQSKNDHGDDLSEFVNRLIERHRAAVVISLDEEGNFKGLFFCTSEMKKAFKAWGEIVFLNGTYKLLLTDLTLMVFVTEDSAARSEIVGIGLLAQEDRPTVEWLARCFKEAHLEHFSNMRCMMADKDLLERDVLKELYEVPVYICRYHVLKTFSRHIAQYSLNATEKQELLDILEAMTYSKSEKHYQHLYTKLNGFLTKRSDARFIKLKAYFDSNWHNIRSEWTAFSMNACNFFNFTNNRLESINKHIKSVVQKRSSLLTFLTDFFVFLTSHNKESDKKTSNSLLKIPVNQVVPDGLEEYAALLMPEIYTKLEKEFAEVGSITLETRMEEGCIVKDNTARLEVTPLACRCLFKTSMELPCRHIFFVRKIFQLPLFERKLFSDRWTKLYAFENNPRFHEIGTLEKQTIASTINIIKPKKLKKMTVPEKRRYFKPLLDDVLTSCSEACGDDAERVSKEVKKLAELARAKKEWKVLTTSELDVLIQKSIQEFKEKSTDDDLVAKTGKATQRADDESLNAGKGLNDSSIASILDISLLEISTPDCPSLSEVVMPTPRRTKGRPSGFLDTTVKIKKKASKTPRQKH